MTPSSDGLLSSILNDDDLQLMDPAAMGADGNKNKIICKHCSDAYKTRVLLSIDSLIVDL